MKINEAAVVQTVYSDNESHSLQELILEMLTAAAQADGESVC